MLIAGVLGLFAAAASSSSGINANEVLAFAAVISLAVTGGFTWYQISKDRAEKAAKSKEKAAADNSTDRNEVKELADLVNRFMIAVIGRPADPKMGLPKIDGFVQEQQAHNTQVDATLMQLRTEMNDENGGGTIKGGLKALRLDVRSMQQTVQNLANVAGEEK